MLQVLQDYQPKIDHLITEDDEPVDMALGKQQRLLTETLYSSWNGPGEGRSFLAEARIGLFFLAKNPAIVPDVLLSLDVEVHEDFRAKEHRSYFLWEFGKPPDVVIEIVSNKKGEEAGEKLQKYARMRIQYYVIFDPEYLLSQNTVTIHRPEGFTYRRHDSMQLPEIRLGLMLWEGEFEGVQDNWLRWVDEQGNLIPTGKEQAERERAQKEAAVERAERLAARLRELGQDPDKF
jgi:hypothetical protein